MLNRLSPAALAVLAAALLLALVVVVEGSNLAAPGIDTGYEPVQPVLFSHQVHAGDLQIACLYCHPAAETSRRAGIPSETTCFGCHRFVAAPLPDVRAEEEAAKKEKREVRPVVSPEIAKVYRALGLGNDGKPAPGLSPEPIRWVRVHNLPDFAFFDHASHVSAGVACETCHGPVDTMARVRQESNLTMGWCVNCHRTANRTGRPDGKPANASTDCTTCHH